MIFEQWWVEYTAKDGNETLSDYEKESARDAWNAGYDKAMSALQEVRLAAEHSGCGGADDRCLVADARGAQYRCSGQCAQSDECRDLKGCTGKYYRTEACACGAPANYDGEWP